MLPQVYGCLAEVTPSVRTMLLGHPSHRVRWTRVAFWLRKASRIEPPQVAKRLAWPQQPNLYLEPKWLRWLLLPDRMPQRCAWHGVIFIIWKSPLPGGFNWQCHKSHVKELWLSIDGVFCRWLCKLTWLVLGEDPAARSHRVEQFTALWGL